MENTMLTKEQKKKYIDDKGCFCPYCGSRQIEGSSMNWDIPLCQEINCIDCGRSWSDVLSITDIIED